MSHCCSLTLGKRRRKFHLTTCSFLRNLYSAAAPSHGTCISPQRWRSPSETAFLGTTSLPQRRRSRKTATAPNGRCTDSESCFQLAAWRFPCRETAGGGSATPCPPANSWRCFEDDVKAFPDVPPEAALVSQTPPGCCSAGTRSAASLPSLLLAQVYARRFRAALGGCPYAPQFWGGCTLSVGSPCSSSDTC